MVTASSTRSARVSYEAILKLAKKRPLICTTILAKDKEHFLTTARKAASLSCDLVELRMDYLVESDFSQIGQMIEESPIPLIVTNRSARDGGVFPLSKELERLSLLELSLDFSPAFLDIELELPVNERSNLIRKARERGVGVICSHHDFRSTPPVAQISSLARRIWKMDVDLAKLVFMINDNSEAWRVLEAASILGSEKKLFTLFGMGPIGRITRLTSLLLGGSLIYSSLDRTDKKLGQIEIRQVKEYTDKLNDFGWARIRRNHNRILYALQKELRSNEAIDYDPLSVLEAFRRRC